MMGTTSRDLTILAASGCLSPGVAAYSNTA